MCKHQMPDSKLGESLMFILNRSSVRAWHVFSGAYGGGDHFPGLLQAGKICH